MSQNSAQPVNAAHATAIVSASGGIYVLDNEQVTITPPGGSSPVVYQSQILPFTIGTGGALQSQNGGAVGDDPTQTNPIMFLAESKGKWFYVANQGDNVSSVNSQSGLVGYFIDPAFKQLNFLSTSPFTSGSGPQCLIEDPSSQYIYTANFNDSSVHGQVDRRELGGLAAIERARRTRRSSCRVHPRGAWLSGRTS